MAYSTGVNQLSGPFDMRINLWTARRQRSQDLKQLYESDWTRYWKWYRNYTEPITDPADWWRSNETIPTVFKIIETLLPRYVIGMFDHPDWFGVEARQRRDADYELLVESLIKATLEEMKLFPKMYEAVKYSLIMGHAWGKIVWREEYTPRQVLEPVLVIDENGQESFGVETVVVEDEEYNNVDFEWLPLDRVFPDPTGEGEWFIEEIDTTMEKLKEVQDTLGIYNRAAFSALLNSTPPPNAMMKGGDALSDARSGTSAGVTVEYNREPEVTEGIPTHYVTPMRDGIGVKLWQCWGWVPHEARGSDGAAWRLAVIANGRHVLRDEPAPTPDGKPPYFAIKSIPIPGILYGESILKYVGPLADQQSRLANMRLDEVFLGVWQQYLYRSNSIVSDNQLLLQPGGGIAVTPEPGQSVQDVFAPLQRRPVLPDAWTEDQYRQVQAEHAAAASDIMQGVSAADRQTATEIERRLQQGNARHMLYTMWTDYTVKKELLERTWKWLQMRLTTPRVIRTAGEEWAAVDVSDIQIPVDIVVSGGMFAMSKETRVTMDQELMSMTTNPVFLPYMKPGPILRKFLNDRGWRDPDKYIKTEEEVMLEQALAMASAQGMGGAAEGQQPGALPGGMGMPQLPQSPTRTPTPQEGFGPGGANGNMSNVLKTGDLISMAGRSLNKTRVADEGV